MATKQGGSGLFTVESFNGTNTVNVDGVNATVVENYILLVQVEKYISYDDTKVKIARVPNNTVSISYNP